MSQENVEIVRGQVERFSSTGESSPETSAVDIVWHDPPNFPDTQVHYGIEGAFHALQTWASAWSEWQVELDEYVDAGDTVLVQGKQRGRGKDSGVWVDQPLCLVYRLRGGKVVEVRAFSTTTKPSKPLGFRGSDRPDSSLGYGFSGVGRGCRRPAHREAADSPGSHRLSSIQTEGAGPMPKVLHGLVDRSERSAEGRRGSAHRHHRKHDGHPQPPLAVDPRPGCRPHRPVRAVRHRDSRPVTVM